jgi:predicted PurR-regulated permease PerM
MELRQFFFKTLIVVGTIVSLYLLYEVRSILLLFFGAVLFASTVRPIVLQLSSRGIPPLISILVIYLGFLGALTGIAIVLFPTLLVSVQDLVNSQTTILQALETAMLRIQSFALNGVRVQLPILRVADLQSYLAEFRASAEEHFQAILLDGFRILSEALIAFVMAFYWFTERDRLEQLALKMLPLRHREKFVSLFGEIETTLGAFVRGQTILCVTVGIFSFIALTALGVRSALVLAVFAAVTEAIPMIGPFLGAVPAILVALLDSPEKGLAVTVAFIVIQQIEAHILVPKVFERQVGLSPLFVLLALTSGNLLGGLLGAVIAIPIAAAVKIILREFVVAPTVQARQFPVTSDGAVLLDEGAGETAAPPETPAPEPPPVTILTSK